jgi:hypothetical protein
MKRFFFSFSFFFVRLSASCIYGNYTNAALLPAVRDWIDSCMIAKERKKKKHLSDCTHCQEDISDA